MPGFTAEGRAGSKRNSGTTSKAPKAVQPRGSKLPTVLLFLVFYFAPLLSSNHLLLDYLFIILVTSTFFRFFSPLSIIHQHSAPFSRPVRSSSPAPASSSSYASASMSQPGIHYLTKFKVSKGGSFILIWETSTRMVIISNIYYEKTLTKHFVFFLIKFISNMYQHVKFCFCTNSMKFWNCSIFKIFINT